MKKHSGLKASQISFPLGGIGSGSIGMAGDGRLIDWEIFNRPAKGRANGFSHLAVRAASPSTGKLHDARIVCGKLPPPYTGTGPGPMCGFGFGPASGTMAGFPNFEKVTFEGEFPFARLDLQDRAFPGTVRLTAFNPFIPGNDKDSSIPAAFFEAEIENTTRETLEYSLAFSISNPGKRSRNFLQKRQGVHAIHLTSQEHEPGTMECGDLCLASDADDVTAQAYWYRGRWSDSLEVFWSEFASSTPLPARDYSEEGEHDAATLMATITVKPKSRGRVRFVLTWNYPWCTNYWHKPETPKGVWKNFYATLFGDSRKSAAYALRNWTRLQRESELFCRALHDSTLPAETLEAISANLAILRSPTVLRLENGELYGWEGCNTNMGSCEGTCTHVWNYAYALPFLFPKLERSIRDLNWKYTMREDGALMFRLKLPLGSPIWNFRACCDGQFGDILKLYRDWKISGDTKWMLSLWPLAKKSLEFAWSSSNEDQWDPEKTGVLHGRQHHTLDMELFGPNSWLTGFYLAALKASAEMADIAGEHEDAADYRRIFTRGKAWVADNLFNGKWFIQQLDLTDESALERYDDNVKGYNKAGVNGYWNSEHRQIKYQIGEGVAIDQVVAQWHANLSGLGEIFSPRQCRAALKAVYKHNFKKTMEGVVNSWRLFSLYDEAGVLICTWPEGTSKPLIPLPYHTETMYGFEYAVAAHMIQEGLTKEGGEIVTKGRVRFEGDRRNPWNEFECGSNYARSMASYSLLPAWSGFEFDATRQMIGFSPKVATTPFRAFWSLDSGWGTIEFLPARTHLTVLYGRLPLSEFRSDRLETVTRVELAGSRIPFSADASSLRFAQKLILKSGQTLKITSRKSS